MAPAATDSPSQADTPMTDANDDVVPSIPVDAPVSVLAFCFHSTVSSPHRDAAATLAGLVHRDLILIAAPCLELPSDS